MITGTNVSGKIATISAVSDDQKTRHTSSPEFKQEAASLGRGAYRLKGSIVCGPQLQRFFF